MTPLTDSELQTALESHSINTETLKYRINRILENSGEFDYQNQKMYTVEEALLRLFHRVRADSFKHGAAYYQDKVRKTLGIK